MLPPLTVLKARDTFDMLFAEMGWRTQVSDKGLYSQEVLRMFGGLDELANYLKLKTVQKIMALYVLKKQNPEDRNRRTYLNFGSRSYLNFEQIMKSADRKSNVSELVDDLVGYGVLIRGLLLRCEVCACLAWYHINETGMSFKCKRCFQDQAITRFSWSWHKAPEPTWFYSLAEIFYQFYKNNSHVPMLAMHKIKSRAKHFDFTPELALYKSGQKKPFREIDMSCVADGDIILGEAKTYEIESADLNPLITLNSQLLPRPVHYVFVTDQKKTKTTTLQEAKASFASYEFMTQKDIY
jgi:hypothetical protein